MSLGFQRHMPIPARPFGRGVALAGVLAMSLGLAACGGPPPVTFDLNSSRPDVVAGRGRGQLVVNEPVASLPADSNRIVIRTGTDAVAYLTGAQWADRLPRLVQSRLIETFENARAMKAVGRPGLAADNVLHTEIRRFEIDVTRSEALVEITAKIVNTSGRIVSADVFSAVVPAPSTEPANATASLDLALSEVMGKIVLWTRGRV